MIQQQQQQLHGPGCCNQLQLRMKLRLEQIKERILTATGLIKPPNMTGVAISNNPKLKEFIDEIDTPLEEPPYPNDLPEGDDEPEVKTEKIYYPVEEGKTGRG